MNADPRLRLLGAPASSDWPESAGAVLARLDETEVVVAASPDADAPARVAIAAFVAMIARLVPHVRIDCAGDLPVNWWQAESWDNLLERLKEVRATSTTAPTQQIKVGFGIAQEGYDLYVGGGDWNVLLGLAPVNLENGNAHALGVHAAACLAVSQVLIMVLRELGFPGVALTDQAGTSGRIETNLVDHGLHTIDRNTPEQFPPVPGRPLRVGFLGVGSVGTSALALLATACSPMLNRTLQASPSLEITAVDRDAFDPGRNPYRYPALLGGESDHKARGVVERLKVLGLAAEAVVADVGSWNSTKADPGWRGVLVSSVDTIPGRLDVADVLGERTLSAGVSGTELHVQWERFADGFACPFCDFVRADPPLTQAGVFAEVTGIPVSRVLALLLEGAALDASDVDMAIAAGRVPEQRREALMGAPLSDLVRQAYAEAEFRPQGNSAGPGADVVAVAAPQVSWLAGTLIAAELVKDMLGLPTLSRRVDLDAGGLPAGLVRSVPLDGTGTCVCHSGVRRRWYRAMYSAAETEPATPPRDSVSFLPTTSG
ncbi:hypothetical protein [Cellulomonas soli]|uniref:THIF-type NAD/FAD binding fold domain-containing protein n=1 Tax=Cellulomonas soli TaxID=931535 RepID=A0A512PIS5_9CELL|nr:hypothetical protein [Cellulomonas soli]NYI58248.1 hypothetical protein [Cellulomonas soli]GEP71104.1 hypothetical protein CSO01_38190 [Cellulomonas soli]